MSARQPLHECWSTGLSALIRCLNYVNTLTNSEGREYVAGIDVGSTSSRVSANLPKGWYGIGNQLDILIENKTSRNTTHDVVQYGDHPSRGYILEGRRPVYYPDDRSDPNRTAIPIKYFIYLLANQTDQMIEKFPFARDLMTVANQPGTTRLMEEGYVKLIKRLLDGLREQVCELPEEPLCSLDDYKFVVTTPGTWDLRAEEVLTRLWSRAMACTIDQAFDRIHYITEAEAVAHFIANDDRCCRYIQKHHGGTPRVVLILDFGGHALVSSRPKCSSTICNVPIMRILTIMFLWQSGCLFLVVRRPGGTLRIFRIGEVFGKSRFISPTWRTPT